MTWMVHAAAVAAVVVGIDRKPERNAAIVSENSGK